MSSGTVFLVTGDAHGATGSVLSHDGECPPPNRIWLRPGGGFLLAGLAADPCNSGWSSDPPIEGSWTSLPPLHALARNGDPQWTAYVGEVVAAFAQAGGVSAIARKDGVLNWVQLDAAGKVIANRKLPDWLPQFAVQATGNGAGAFVLAAASAGTEGQAPKMAGIDSVLVRLDGQGRVLGHRTFALAQPWRPRHVGSRRRRPRGAHERQRRPRLGRAR